MAAISRPRLLQLAAATLGLAEESAERFSLFLVKPGDGKNKYKCTYFPPSPSPHTTRNTSRPLVSAVVHWLKELESPYLSLQNLNQRTGHFHKILIRKQ